MTFKDAWENLCRRLRVRSSGHNSTSTSTSRAVKKAAKDTANSVEHAGNAVVKETKKAFREVEKGVRKIGK